MHMLSSEGFEANAEDETVENMGILKPVGFGRAIFVACALAAILFGATGLGQSYDWFAVYPDSWEIPTRAWIGGFMDWLVKEFSLGLFTFQEFTRSIAWLLSWPFSLVNGVLWRGFDVGADWTIPPLSWSAIFVLVGLLGWWLKGWRLVVLGLACMAFLVVFGYWESAMKTLSSILMVIPIACVLGVYLGVVCYRSPRAKFVITPMLDFMQTVPIFAYLLPILFLFGFGPLSAMIATLIYSMPPMVRSTLLGLQIVSTEVKECGIMSGATDRQLMWRIMIPSAKHSILVGLNQVIMLSLNAVIIASLIGAGGLGYDVMRALKSLSIGQGLEAGLAIVLLAIVLDRFSRTFADRAPKPLVTATPAMAQHIKVLITGVGLASALQVLSIWVPWLQLFPKDLTLTTSPFWDSLVDWIVIDYYDALEVFKNSLLLYLLLPVKHFMTALPWTGVIASLTFVGYLLGGRRLAFTVSSLALFILVSGFWEKAIITVHLIGVSVILALLIGFPLGVWASINNKASHTFRVIADTLQTLPSFVYLIPVVMLFQAGDVSAIIAVVAYAIAPIIRYTDNGLRQVPPDIIEAAVAIGCNRWQVMIKVKRVLALPEIVLGINQTIMLAISMLVITALVGTRDLGQEVFIGLARTDTGRGLVAGISVACIAIITDRMLQAYVRKEKSRLGLS